MATGNIVVKQMCSFTTASTQTVTGPGKGGWKTFQGVITSTGTGTAAVTIQASNDNANWITRGTLSVAATNATVTSSFIPSTPEAWGYWRVSASNVGTSSTFVCYMGEEQ